MKHITDLLGTLFKSTAAIVIVVICAAVFGLVGLVAAIF